MNADRLLKETLDTNVEYENIGVLNDVQRVEQPNGSTIYWLTWSDGRKEKVTVEC